MLFIYGGNDPETEPSRQFYREFVQSAGIPHAFHELAGANHNFFGVDWKREVIATTIEWLEHQG
jgi:acetyl esterase/lipase